MSTARESALRVGFDSVAAATTAAATTASARKSARFRRSAIARPIRRAEHRKLNRVPLSCALRAGNLLLLVQYDLLEVRLAILANVFVDGHIGFLSVSSPIIAATANKRALQKAIALRLVGGQLQIRRVGQDA